MKEGSPKRRKTNTEESMKKRKKTPERNGSARI